MSGFFSGIDAYKRINKILIGVIVGLVLLNLLIVKSLISIASNKTVQISVPQFLEEGNYIIGSTFASENVYKMWVKVWVESMANFSYKDLAEKYEGIYPFLDTQTAFKSKSEIQKFIKFVQTNYITQSFSVEDLKVEKLKGGFVKVTAFGYIKRKIGSRQDKLSGMRYAYEFITYVRNGQLYINSIKTSFYGLTDKNQRDKLTQNKFVNFDEVLK